MKKITHSSNTSCGKEVDNTLMIIMILDHLASEAIEARLMDVAKLLDETLYNILALSCSKYRDQDFEKKLSEFSDKFHKENVHQMNNKKVHLGKSYKIGKRLSKAAKSRVFK